MKIELELRDDNGTKNLYDGDGAFVCTFLGKIKEVELVEPKGAFVLELIKQGVHPDEIIKLKNNDLL